MGSEAITWFEVHFESVPTVVPENSQFKDTLALLEDTSNENEKKKIIKQIIAVYKTSIEEKVENVEAKNIILHLFTKFNSKRVLKKYLQDLICKLDLSTLIVQSTAEEIQKDMNARICCNIRQCIDLLSFVFVIQNTPSFKYTATIEYLFPIYHVVFEGFVFHAQTNFTTISTLFDELYILMNAILKQILLIFVKQPEYIEVISTEYSARFAILGHTTLMHDKVGFDLKTKAGLVLVHSFNLIPEKHRKNFKYKDCPPLELLKNYSEEKYFTLINNKMSIFKHSDDVVILYSSIFNVVPQDKLIEATINGQTLICLLYNGLMECSKSKTSIPHIIIETSRTLSVLSKHLKLVPKDLIKPLFMEGIYYVWSHIEHFVDTVRNYAKLFFIELVNVAALHKKDGYTELADILLENIRNLDPTQSIRLLAFENIAVHLGCVYLMEHFIDLPEDLLCALSDSTIAEQACKTYIAVMEKHAKEINREDWVNIWVMAVVRVLKNCTHCTPFCQKIISQAFQIHPPVLRTIFPNDYIGTPQECGVLLKCLRYARNNGMELTIEKKESNLIYWRGLIDKDKLEKFIIHQDDEIRLSALAIIVESQKSTEVFLDWELDYLCKYIHYNITSQIPSVRKQIVSYFKKALNRFHAGYHVLERNISILTKKLEVTEEKKEAYAILQVYQELENSYTFFLKRFTKQLIANLTFDSNYPRRATTLELLISIQAIMSTEMWLACWSEDDVKNCHGILFDGYESNKKMAVMLLKHLPPAHIGFTNVDFTFKYMQRCLNIALAIKPSKTLSAAYLLEVCAFSPYFFNIVQSGNNQGSTKQVHNPILDMLVVLTGKLNAQTNLTLDVTNPKVANYGILLSIRHLLQIRDISKNNEAYSCLFEHFTTICLNLKDHIMPIVCNPSPEGYLPEVDEVIPETDESAKAQMILVYAWRTMKEMTLLLAEIIRQSVKLERFIEMLGENFMIKIGELFLTIFIESKHRGVFEQAYIGFSVICESFWISSNPKLNHLPKLWLQDALNLCTGETVSDKLCPTRRSGGLPFLILAILGSEHTFDKPRFHNTITTLFKICDNVVSENSEYRMHCMNVLRAMFRHSRLGEIVSSYIGAGVKVAIKGFTSEDWGVRNSATLLYSALMTRMFGVQRTQDSVDVCMKNRLTVRVFFMRYPELFQFLFETLTQECTKNNSLMLHPVLMILARLYPSHLEEYNVQVEKYLPHLEICLGNQVYKTRDLAARASVPLMHTERISSRLDEIFCKMESGDVGNDECHGLLLQVWHILKSNHLPGVYVDNYIPGSIQILSLAGSKYSHLTASLYMDVIMLFLMKYNNYRDLETLKNIVSILSSQITSNLLPITSKSKYPETRMLLLLYIVINKFEENDLTYPTVTNQIMCQLYGHDVKMKRFCLNMLIYLNQVQNEPSVKHALYQMEELQIPAEIVILVDSFEKSSVTKILTHIHQYLKCFLTEEIKFQYYIRKEDQVLLFLLVNYYPCVIKYLNLSKQETLNMLINFCNCDNEELISAVVSCISTFLLQLDYSVLRYDRLIQALVESASPAVREYRRLAVSDFLTKNYILYCSEDAVLVGDELQMVLNIVMVLLEDDDLMVRNSMSMFATALKIKITLNNNPNQTLSGQRWPIIPEKAREDLLVLGSIIMPRDRAICFLFSWACRHFPDSSNDASEVFERGELNLYAENVPFMSLCGRLLYKLLWPLEEGLSYEDKSIFIEEQTLIVTTVLLDSLLKNPSPMMLYKTKVSVICALKSTVKFLERFEINNNFVNEFRIYLNETILGYLTKHVEHSDLFSVKWIVKNIYDPVLNHQS